MPPTPEELELAPEQLWDMKYVWLHPEPEDPKDLDSYDKQIEDIRKLRREKPFDFLDRLRALQKDFRQAKEKKRDQDLEQAKAARTAAAKDPAPSPTIVHSEPVWDGQAPCPTCKREPLDQETKEARDRGLAWLEEYGDE